MLWPWLMAFGLPFPLLALRAERRFRSLPTLVAARQAGADLPAISVIVPARNEEDNLKILLPSLKIQDYTGKLEILVVDDHSTDRTSEIAASFNVPVVSAPELPPGWYGKPHACHTGASRTRGEWLVFVDADTQLFPGCLRAAVSHASGQGLDGLSLLFSESSTGLLDRLALMAAFAGLFAGMQPEQPLLNGQFILLRRDAYTNSGGFSEVRAEPIEDLALANLLNRCGYRVPILLGHSAGQVRMYRGTRHLWRGLVRLGSGALKWSGVGGWLTASFITGALLPLLAVPLAVFDDMPPAFLAAAWAVVAMAFIPWAVRAGKTRYAILAPFGAFFVQLAAVTGLIRNLAGLGVPWKDRNV